jgi:hypothetical protein
MEKLLVILKNSFILFFIIILISLESIAQEKKSEFTLSGYVKYLPSYLDYNSSYFDSETSHLIHNRLNLRGYFGENFSLGLEFRNRMIFGENSYISSDDGLVDLSFFIVDNTNFKMHSMIDRFWLKYQKNKIEISIGRQRVNWGINTIWNSNDLFNAYNFIDFDYIERPGSDVIRFQYTADNLSSFDLVYKPSSNQGAVIAGLYKINKLGYDFQFLGANYYDDIAIGTGWAGNIKNAGFKGELTYFIVKNSQDIFPSQQKNSTSLSTSVDYSFKNGFYILGSYLYNSNGFSDPSVFSLGSLTENVLSPKNLMPSKNSYLIQASKPITPAINSSLTILYGKGVNFMFISPNITYDINKSFDLNFIAQFFYGEVDDDFQNLLKGVYLQIRYSF